MNQAKFYWAIVGDAGPEPVAVVEENGKKMAYTCGCQDPFEVGDNIQLISAPGQIGIHALELPKTPKEQAKERLDAELRLQALMRRGEVHKHKRFSPKVQS